MGFNASWLAVRGKPAESVLAVLGLQPTGDFEELPESPLTGISLPSGWYLIFANDFDFVARAPLSALSHAAEVVTCAAEEHVMQSRASGWKDGTLTWSISHEAQRGISHLEPSGRPPPQYQDVRLRLLAKQSAAGGDDADVDYIFEVPVEVASALTGFRHDQWIEGAKFTRLK